MLTVQPANPVRPSPAASWYGYGQPAPARSRFSHFDPVPAPLPAPIAVPATPQSGLSSSYSHPYPPPPFPASNPAPRLARYVEGSRSLVAPEPNAVAGTAARPQPPPAPVHSASYDATVHRGIFRDVLIFAALSVVTEFCRANKMPLGTDLSAFLVNVVKCSRTTSSVLRVAVYYLIRVRDKLPTLKADIPSGRRLFVTALILAFKYLHDKNFTVRGWSKLAYIHPDDINKYELSFLKALDWRLHITTDTFGQWEKFLSSYSPILANLVSNSSSANTHKYLEEWNTVITTLQPDLQTLPKPSYLKQVGVVSVDTTASEHGASVATSPASSATPPMLSSPAVSVSMSHSAGLRESPSKPNHRFAHSSASLAPPQSLLAYVADKQTGGVSGTAAASFHHSGGLPTPITTPASVHKYTSPSSGIPSGSVAAQPSSAAVFAGQVPAPVPVLVSAPEGNTYDSGYAADSRSSQYSGRNLAWSLSPESMYGGTIRSASSVSSVDFSTTQSRRSSARTDCGQDGAAKSAVHAALWGNGSSPSSYLPRGALVCSTLSSTPEVYSENLPPPLPSNPSLPLVTPLKSSSHTEGRKRRRSSAGGSSFGVSLGDGYGYHSDVHTHHRLGSEARYHYPPYPRTTSSPILSHRAGDYYGEHGALDDSTAYLSSRSQCASKYGPERYPMQYPALVTPLE